MLSSMLSDNKPKAVGVLCDNISTSEGHEGISYLKSLGMTCITSFAKSNHQTAVHSYPHGIATIYYLQYDSKEVIPPRIIKFIKSVEKRGDEVVLLYKRKGDGTFGFYSCSLNVYGDVQFGINITKTITSKVERKIVSLKKHHEQNQMGLGKIKDVAWSSILPSKKPLSNDTLVERVHSFEGEPLKVSSICVDHDVFDTNKIENQIDKIKREQSTILLRKRRKLK